MKKWILLSSCLLVAALIAMLWVGTVFAEVEKLTLEELTNRASTIVRGVVVRLKSHWDEDHAVIYTSVTISVTDHVKGRPEAEEIIIEVPGGIVGEIGMTVSDVPRFEKGEEVILFLEEYFQALQVVGWFQGKYTIVDNMVVEKRIPVNQFIGQIHAIMERSGIRIEPTPTAEKGPTKPAMEKFRHERLDITNTTEGPRPEALGEIAPSEAAAGWTNIMTEGFEGAFPGTEWTLDGDPTWDETSYRAHSGSWSGYCADGGSNRVDPPGPYPNNVRAWMVYGPFNLSDATDAELLFSHWTKTEPNYDYLFVGASINGANFYGTGYGGDWASTCGGWCEEENFDLTDVYTLGNLCGQSQVWIAFKFHSDSSNTYEGSYLDDITLRKGDNGGDVPHIDSLSPDHGPAHADELGSCDCAADSTRVTINGSDFGSAQGTSYVRFWRVDSTYYNACVESWSDTQIVARVPGCVSSGDVVVITDGGTSNGVYFTVTYSYGGGKWPKGGYPQPMSEEYRVNASSGPTGALAAIHAAADTWSNVICADFFFRYGGTSEEKSYGYNGENTILWQDLPTGILGVNSTVWFTSDPHTIIEFDIAFNTDYTWGTDCSAGKYDVQSIGAHELGHALQLLDLYDTADEEKIMYGRGSAGECKRNLHLADIAGICYIYPLEARPDLIIEDISWSPDPISGDDNVVFTVYIRNQGDVDTSPWGPFDVQYYIDDSNLGEWIIDNIAAGTTISRQFTWDASAGNHTVSAYADHGGFIPESNENNNEREESFFVPCPDPPTTPYNPSPPDGATGVSINADLSWSGGHPCPGESVTYDVYFDTSDPPTTLICDDVSSATCDPGILDYNTHYYWQVAANGLNGPSDGPVWDFLTTSCPDPPTTPYNPSPADGATGVSINADLSWSGGHPCPGESVTYDVYFDTSDPPTTLICDDVSSATCDPGILDYNTHYYWQVAANGLNGPSDGPVWDFLTTSCPDPPTTPYNPSPADGATGVSINADLSWSGEHPCPGESVTYDVYFDTSDPPTTLICDDVSSPTCDPGTLSCDTHYYWKVVGNGLNGPSPGPVWDFTTGCDGDGPNLTIPDRIPAYPGGSVEVPIEYTSNGHEISALTFSVDFDEGCLSFDDTDGDGDDIPDAVTLNIPGEFNASVTYDSQDTDGELDIFIADLFPPLSGLPDGTLATIELTVTCTPSDEPIIVPVNFSSDPSPSFGNTAGQSVSGTWDGGSVEIVVCILGDCNGDGVVDAGDISACVLEIFDGDGNQAVDAPGGTFPGTVCCDCNEDGIIDAGDISCTVLAIFSGSGAYGGGGGREPTTGEAVPFDLAESPDGPVLAIPEQLRAWPGASVTVPINYTANGHSISAAVFSVDFDEEWLSFDPADDDGDGIPDAVRFNVPDEFGASVTFDASDTDGELDFFIAELFPPLASLLDGTIITIRLDVARPFGRTDVLPARPPFGELRTIAAVGFSQDPAASLGNLVGESVPGVTEDGSALISLTHIGHLP